jgi:transglutaminase-like putative cysteine protease
MKRAIKGILATLIILICCLAIVLMAMSFVPGSPLYNAIAQMISQSVSPHDISQGVGDNSMGFAGSTSADYDTKVLSFTTSYQGGVYFRYQSDSDYDSRTGNFSNSAVYNKAGLSQNPLTYFATKGSLGKVDSYPISVSVQTPYQKGFAVDYSQGPTYLDEDNGNDTYLANPNANSYAYDTTFIPELSESQAKATPFTSDVLLGEEADYEIFVRTKYLALPSAIEDDLIAFMKANNLYSQTTTAQDIKDFLQANYTYRVQGESASQVPSGTDRILYFLTTSKTGVCNNFASAEVMMCRALKIPARFVTGFYGISGGSGETTVTLRGCHAWSEVYVSGSGWQRVDPTGGAGGEGVHGGNSSSTSTSTSTAPQVTGALLISVKDTSILYDGTYHSPSSEMKVDASLTLYRTGGTDTYEGTNGSFSNGYKYSFGWNTSAYKPRKQVGMYQLNVLGITILDDQGNLFYSNETTNIDQGWLSTNQQVSSMEVTYQPQSAFFIIEARALTVTTPDLTCTKADLASLPNQRLVCTTAPTFQVPDNPTTGLLGIDLVSSYTYSVYLDDVGEAENTLSDLVLKDQEGNEVTLNYEITYVYGKLKVTA